MKKNWWKKTVCFLLAGVMALGLAGCGNGGKKKTSDGLTEMDVVLDWYPNAIHTFLYDAVEKGYFKEEGIKVKLIPPAESVDALTFVSAGKAQIGLTYPIEIIKSKVKDNMPVRAIGAVTQYNLTCLATLEGSGITDDMKTMKGKKIGYDGTASSEAMIRTVAKSAGLSDDDYEMVNVGFDLTTALTTKSVDMTAGMMLNDEIITMRNEGYKVKTFNYSNYDIPEMYDIVMVANDKDYQKNKKLYDGFLRACQKGFKDMKGDEDASLEIIMNKMNSEDNPLDEKQQRQSYETLIPKMETKDAPFLSMTDKMWQSTIDWMKATGQIKKTVKTSDIMTAPAQK